MTDPPRKLGSFSEVSIWSTAEPSLGIVSACMPTMKPLLLRLFPQGNFRDHVKSRKKSGSGSSSKRYRSDTTPFGLSGFNKWKIGRAHQQFRKLNDGISERLATHSHITDGEAGRGKLDIPLNTIEVQTYMDKLASRKDFQPRS
ncbi:MAG: hypothetical protein Q9196_004802 [Gyalolechia fulgens]